MMITIAKASDARAWSMLNPFLAEVCRATMGAGDTVVTLGLRDPPRPIQSQGKHYGESFIGRHG